MAKREFLQLAHVYKPERDSVTGWFASEKLDGMRCFWDGGVSRGLPCDQVPWANTAKHARYQEQRIATGLWSRYAQPIYATDSFLDALPNFPLDGELYAGPGRFQFLCSTVKSLHPDEEAWESVRFLVFDSPLYREVFANGFINNTNMCKRLVDAHLWALKRAQAPEQLLHTTRTFEQTYLLLQSTIENNDVVQVHEQIKLPTYDREQSLKTVDRMLNNVLTNGGEGLMLRNPNSYWSPSRTYTLLKVKGQHDDEGLVVGYTYGRETDKGSKLLGMMGNLILDYKGKLFELSGFTDEERKLSGTYKGITAFEHGCLEPGTQCPSWVTNVLFPRGNKVTFKYRELTDEGIPKEARYFRKKVEE